jgi:hypothetical protein
MLSQFVYSIDLGCTNAQKNANPFAGNGTFLNPYKICTVVQFNRIANNAAYLNKKFRLMEDLDFTGKTLNEIGTEATPFTGEFNGGNNKMSNIVFTKPANDDVGIHGIFRAIKNANIYNLNIVKPFMDPTLYPQGGFGWSLGILVGHAKSSWINDVKITQATMPGRDYSGILVGHLEDSFVSDSKTTGWITNTTSADALGGLVGMAYHSFITCSDSTVKIDYAYLYEYMFGFSDATSCHGGLIGAAQDSTIHNAETSGLIQFPMDQNGNYLPQNNHGAEGYGQVLGCAFDSCYSRLRSNLVLKVQDAQYQGGLVGWIQ